MEKWFITEEWNESDQFLHVTKKTSLKTIITDRRAKL